MRRVFDDQHILLVSLDRLPQEDFSDIDPLPDAYDFRTQSYRVQEVKELPDVNRPPLPPSVPAGGHGGSHGYLMNKFVTAVLLNRLPLVSIAWALNMTVSGIVAHQSALRNGEAMKIPQFVMRDSSGGTRGSEPEGGTP